MKPLWIFILVPLIFLITTFAYIQNAGPYFAGTVDPEYNYLFNGITLAHLKLHLNAVGHPGTPVQILIALVAWAVHLFRPGHSLWDDVILNPEVYIEATVYTANIINAVFLFILGIQVFKYSRKLIYSIVLQLSPFAFLLTIEVSYRMMPELIMTSIISCWLILLVKLLYEPTERHNYKKYSLLFGVLFGFSLAGKLTFLPFILLPLLMLPGSMMKLRFSIISLLTFAIVAFPAMLNIHKFTGWVSGIFLHKGVYGSGEKGVIDWPVFANNFEILWKNTLQLWIPLIIALVLALFVKRKNRNDATVKMTFALNAVVIVQYIITSKHYAFYYFTPSLLMAVFSGFLVILLVGRIYPVKQKNWLPDLLLVTFASILIINVFIRINRQFEGLPERKRVQRETVESFRSLLDKSDHRIICASYYGCSAVEYGLLFGLLESGRYGRELTAIYNKHYPSSYIYLHWFSRFYNGIYVSEPQDFLKSDVEYTLYVADYSDGLFKKVLSELQPDSALFRQDVKMLYKSDNTFEAIYLFKLINKK